MEIYMPHAVNDIRIGEAFNHLFRIILKMENSDDDDFIWNFQYTAFVTPFFLLPLMLYRDKCGKNVVCKNISDSVKSYLDSIHFEGGVVADSVSDFHNYMEYFSMKKYIPIIKFPGCKSKDSIKNDILSVAENIMIRQLNIEGELRKALSYMLTETIDNISEHSESEFGYIFAQYYPSKSYIDICIADNGISILGSYVKSGKGGITNDVEALKSAGKGISTKNLPDTENRGYGISTCKRMLSKGLGGTYLLLSGQAFHLMSEEETSYIGLPDYIKWDGTIVALRIPYKEERMFNFYEYLE